MPKKKPVKGACCACGYDQPEETDCPGSEDGQHCEHWWRGPDGQD